MGATNIRGFENRVIENVRSLKDIADDTFLRARMPERNGILGFLSANSMILGEDGIERPMVLEEAMPLILREQRRKNLAPLAGHIAQIVDGARFKMGRNWQKMRATYKTLRKGGNLIDQRSPLERAGADSRFSNLEDPADIVLSSILREPMEGRELMTQIDKLVYEKSEALLKEMDELKMQGKRKRISFAIVGDGLNTSTALTAVGAFTDTVVISNQAELASDWRYNPLFINSSSDQSSVFAVPLPLLKGVTTGIVPKAIIGGVIKAADLLGNSALVKRFKTKILKDDGEIQRKSRTKKFLSGHILGRGAAANIFGHADHFLMNQEVIPSLTRLGEDGVKTIVMRDTRTNELRELDVDTTAFLTGPGKEKLAITDAKTQALYKESMARVDTIIASVEEQKNRGDRVSFEIPRLLTLTSIRKLYRMWDKILERDPALYPFRDLMREDALVGQVGGADTTRTMTELVAGRGPRESYPDEFDFTPPRQILYNVPQRTPREYNLANRTRYWGVVDNRVTTKKEKVLRIVSTSDPEKLFLIGEEGDLRVLDFVIVSTGFERLNIEDELQKAGIQIEDYRDDTGQVVGLGNKDNGVLINGPATGFGKDRFPPQIRAVIDALGIKENTVALWVYQILITRMLWTHFAKKGAVNLDKVDDLLQSALSTSPDALFAETDASLT